MKIAATFVEVTMLCTVSSTATELSNTCVTIFFGATKPVHYNKIQKDIYFYSETVCKNIRKHTYGILPLRTMTCLGAVVQ